MKKLVKRLESHPALYVVIFALATSVGLFQNCTGSFSSLGTLAQSSGSSILGGSHTPQLHSQENAVTSAKWAGGSSVFSHQIGSASGQGWAVLSTSAPGFMTFGPYLNAFQPGAYSAKFSLTVDNNSADDQKIGYVDVFDNMNNVVLGHRDFHRKEFAAAGAAQDFEVTFSVPASNYIEFRVYYYGYSYLVHNSTTVAQVAAYKTVTFNAQDPAYYHQIGEAAGTIGWAATSALGSGYLAYGPYTSQFKPGTYLATYDLLVDNNAADDLVVATIDVNEPSTGTILATRDINRKDFYNAQTRQSFELPFSYDGRGALEFRIYLHGASYVQHFATTISENSVLEFAATDPSMGHLVGYAEGNGWSTDTTRGEGFLTYGPYTYAAPVGGNTVSFNLSIDNNSADNGQVARVVVFDTNSNVVLAQRTIFRQNFAAANTPQDFDLVFEQLQNTRLEFRIYTYGDSKLTHFTTTLRPDRLTLTDLWNQKAHFEFQKRDSLVYNGVGDSNTSSLVTLDGIWYAFNRQAITTPSACSAVGALQVVVRESGDRGLNWSDPVVVASPTGGDGSGTEGCMVVDGGAFYDQDNDTWHYLGQCIGASSGWNLCHYTKNGSSPMGLFSKDAANPVVNAGQLWKQICAGGGKSCPANMVDEGTPQIVGKQNGYYYVTFHGAAYNNTVVLGARGIARTPDFHNWETSGADLPGDAMHSATDCNKWGVAWSGGCIGTGAARMLRSNGYTYSLTEAADKSLVCQVNQNWVFGLMRAKNYAVSGNWESYIGNPLVNDLNVSPVGCALQYMSLIRDRGEQYMMFGAYVPEYGWPNYTYRLVDGAPASASMNVK